MGKTTFFDNVREWWAGVTFAIYLHAIQMTKEEFWAEQDRQAVEHSVHPTLFDWCEKCDFLAVDRKTGICGVCNPQSG